MPNVLHDVFKLKISTGARRTFLSDADLEVQKHFGINDYTDTHDDNAGVPHTRGRSLPGTAPDHTAARCVLPAGVQRLVFSATEYPNIRRYFRRAVLRRATRGVECLNHTKARVVPPHSPRKPGAGRRSSRRLTADLRREWLGSCAPARSTLRLRPRPTRLA
jgi:hypothetical protein